MDCQCSTKEVLLVLKEGDDDREKKRRLKIDFTSSLKILNNSIVASAGLSASSWTDIIYFPLLKTRILCCVHKANVLKQLLLAGNLKYKH